MRFPERKNNLRVWRALIQVSPPGRKTNDQNRKTPGNILFLRGGVVPNKLAKDPEELL